MTNIGLALKHLSNSLNCLKEEDKEIIGSLINKYKDLLSEVNLIDYSIESMTVKENGRIVYPLKNAIRHYFFGRHYTDRLSLISRHKNVEEYFEDILELHFIPEKIIGHKLYIHRYLDKTSPLYFEINETIKTLAIKNFILENKEKIDCFYKRISFYKKSRGRISS